MVQQQSAQGEKPDEKQKIQPQIVMKFAVPRSEN
jgi:hypothetical protein